MHYTILIGGYNQSHFGGIQEVVLRCDGTLEGLSGINGPMNPSFLAWKPDDRRLFALNETSEGAELCLLAYDGAGTSVRSRAPFAGRGLCHVGISPDGRLVGGACFGSGDVTLFACGEAGFAREVFHKCYTRPGVISHPHCMLSSPDGRFFYLVDLGRDCVTCYDCTGDKPAECGSLQLAEGDGPRQLLFHPTLPLAWLITEYSNVVYTLGWDAETGQFSVLQRLTTLPEGYADVSYGASLAYNPDLGLLYGSNRGMESIALFKADSAGMLTPDVIVPCHGSWPRHIALTRDNAFLLCCNERTDELCVLPLDDKGVPQAPVTRVTHKRCSFAIDIGE